MKSKTVLIANTASRKTSAAHAKAISLYGKSLATMVERSTTREDVAELLADIRRRTAQIENVLLGVQIPDILL